MLTGTEGDATPFTDVTVANVSSTLHKIGFQKHGNEVMYSGHTGRMLNTKVRTELEDAPSQAKFADEPKGHVLWVRRYEFLLRQRRKMRHHRLNLGSHPDVFAS